MANPYSEDATKKFNSMELLVPRTGTIHHLCKLPQSLYMPGACHSELLVQEACCLLQALFLT